MAGHTRIQAQYYNIHYKLKSEISVGIVLYCGAHLNHIVCSIHINILYLCSLIQSV